MTTALGLMGGGLIAFLVMKHPEAMRTVMVIVSAIAFVVGVIRIFT